MKISKKRVTLALIIIIALVSTIVLLTSYAWWRVKDNQTGTNDLLGACLKLSYTEEKDSNNNPIRGFSLESAYPITDTEALELHGYNFTITNTCDEDVDYEVVIESLKTADPTKPMPEEYIRFKIDDNPVKKYSDLPEVDNDTGADYYEDILKTRQIYSDTLPAQQSVTHNVKSWIGEDATKEVAASNQFESKVKVRAGQGIIPMGEDEKVCYAILPNGTITHYNPDCGPKAAIPSEYMGIPVRAIATGTFYEDVDNTLVYQLDGNYTVNDIDFLFGLSSKAVNAMITEDENAIKSLTSEDVWFIKYSDNEHLDEAIENAMASDDQIAGIKEMLEANDQSIDKICTYGEPDCDLGDMTVMYTATGDQEYNGEQIGMAMQGTIAKEFGVVDSETQEQFTILDVDLSNATNLVEIGDNVFYYPKDTINLTFNGTSELILPNSLKTIGDWAFASYYGQEQDLVIPNSVTTVGDYAFASFSGSNLSLSNIINHIGEGAFGSYNGPTLALNDNIEYLGPAAFYSYVGEGKNLVIPSGVSEILDSTFYSFDGNEIVFHDNVTDIGDNAFRLYSGENQTLDFPNSLKTIGAYAFLGYLGTGQDLVLPNSVTEIGFDSFANFIGRGLTLSNQLTEIPGSAFFDYVGDADGGQTLVIPDSVTKIGNLSFGRFRGANLILGNGVKIIDVAAFDHYEGYNQPLVFPEGIEVIDNHAFEWFSGTDVIIPSSIKLIGNEAFGENISNPTYDPNTRFADRIIIKKSKQDFFNDVMFDNFYYQQVPFSDYYITFMCNPNYTEVVFDPD